MPIVEVHVLEGYGSAEKKRLGEALTDAVRFVVPAAPDAVTVLIREVPSDSYFRGRTRRNPAPARPDPKLVVRNFLAAMEQRDLDAASAMLGQGFSMQFPGTGRMTLLEELIAWSNPRYRFVTKSYERFDAMPGDGTVALVYCFGTLSGEWLTGEPFSGIRFIDRFEIEDGRIVRQDVWNDMAEVKAKS